MSIAERLHADAHKWVTYRDFNRLRTRTIGEAGSSASAGASSAADSSSLLRRLRRLPLPPAEAPFAGTGSAGTSSAGDTAAGDNNVTASE